jgi:uncharacterized membrane-anchored protein
MSDITLVEKEAVSKLHFPSADVLTAQDAIQKRQEMMRIGIRLGNNHKNKVKIIFEDETGMKQVETTIWEADEKVISLKGGVYIPVNRIHQIKIY